MSKISSIRETWKSLKPHMQTASRYVAKWALPKDKFERYEAQMAKGWLSRKRAQLKVVWNAVKKLFSTLKELFTKK